MFQEINYDSKLAGYERIVYLAFAIREDMRPLARYGGTNEATQISMCFFVVSGTQLFYAKQEPHQRRLVADCRYSSQPDLNRNFNREIVNISHQLTYFYCDIVIY